MPGADLCFCVGGQVGLLCVQTSLLPCTVPRSMREAVQEGSQGLQNSHVTADHADDKIIYGAA